MKQRTIYTARDDAEFNDKNEAEEYDYIYCTKDNEAFVISSSFYGQFRSIVKTYKEVQQALGKSDGLMFERISLGEYSLVKE